MAFQHQTYLQHSFSGQPMSPATSDGGNWSDTLPVHPYIPQLPSYESDGAGDHFGHSEPMTLYGSEPMTLYGSEHEYEFFKTAYELIGRRCGKEYQGASQRFEHSATMPWYHAPVIWTSYLFNPGKRCKYTFALREVIFLVGTLDVNTEEDRRLVGYLAWLACGVVNHRSSFEPLHKSQRYTLGKWEHVRDTLEYMCTKQ